MIILGIDPGTAKTGYALIDVDHEQDAFVSEPRVIEVDCLNTPAGVDMHLRLHLLYKNLKEITSKYKPDMMIVESLFFNTNVKTAISVGQARGIYLLLAAEHNMNVIEYTALQAKNTLTGYGRATKKEMQHAVKEYLGLDEIIKPDDANDALAIVLCHLEKHNGRNKAKYATSSVKDKDYVSQSEEAN